MLSKTGLVRFSLKVFCKGFFMLLGIGFGIIVVSSMLDKSFSGPKHNTSSAFTMEMMPNVEGKREFIKEDAPTVLQIDISGVIGMKELNTELVKEILIESQEGYFEKNKVKAILLKINSPGGTVTDSDGIYRLIKSYKELHEVPVYAYVDGLCASGGMYIAAAADKVYASDVSLVGSVGVILSTFFNLSEPLKKLGIETKTIMAGKGKDEMNPLRPWKKDEGDSYREITDFYYKSFVSIVANSRPNLDENFLVDVAGAKVYPAKIAEEVGLIDGSNYEISNALQELVEIGGLEKEKYQVIRLSKKMWWSDVFKEKLTQFNGSVKHQVQLGGELDPSLQNKFLYLYHPAY